MATPKNMSVLKAFRLLQCFGGPDEWLTSSELSRRARLPEASGYRIVQTLEGIGAVVRDRRGRYRPGMLLLSLSQGIISAELWSRACQPVLDEIVCRLDACAHVGVLEDGMVTYLAAGGRRDLGLSIRTGMQFEAYCTAIGKVLLAGLSEAALDDFLDDGELVPLTENTITNPDELRRATAEIRVRRLATDDCETLEGLFCIAAPVCDPAGRTVAAVSVSDHRARMDDARQAQTGALLNEASHAIAAKLFPWSEEASERARRARPAARPALRVLESERSAA